MVRILAAAFLCAAMASAQTTVIRLGTLVPKGSSWHKILIAMGDQWSKDSNGKIELKIYPGGEQGDEPEMVDKVRIKKLQAVALSGAGLTSIDAGVAALQIPMMLNSYEELDYIRDKIAPRLEKEFLARGFVVLNWGDAGWVHFFTKQAAMSPDDIRKMKLCVLQGDNSTMRLYQLNGFHPVALAATDILPGLQTGLIDAIQSPPLIALANQWFGGAKNMLDIKFTSLVGATLIRKDVWDSIPKDVQKKMKDAALVAGVGLREEIRKAEAQSVPIMRQFGLNVVHADDKTVAEWRALVEGIYPKLRGPYIPADLFDQVVKLRDEYRKAHPEPKS
jgi:TRAP-type C4-dicarboxylate transport system substrate-binding protein